MSKRRASHYRLIGANAVYLCVNARESSTIVSLPRLAATPVGIGHREEVVVAQKDRDQFIAKESKRLKHERAQVEDELRNLRELMQAEVDVEPDEGDSEIFEREKNAALIAVLERRLADIDAASRSIDKGKYGTCDRCGKQIELARLEIKPDATLCVTCQGEVERLSKRNRPARQIEW